MNWEKIIEMLEAPFKQKLLDYIKEYPEFQQVIEDHFERLKKIGVNELKAFINLYLQQTAPPPSIVTSQAIDYDRSLQLRWDIANQVNARNVKDQEALLQTLLLAILSIGLKEISE